MITYEMLCEQVKGNCSLTRQEQYEALYDLTQRLVAGLLKREKTLFDELEKDDGFMVSLACIGMRKSQIARFGTGYRERRVLRRYEFLREKMADYSRELEEIGADKERWS